jgi:hypothetical protein
VTQKPLFRSFQDGNYLEVTCWGWDGVLANCTCIGPHDEMVWTMESDYEELTDLPLLPSDDYGTFQGSTLWPDPSDADGLKCYTEGASDTLTVAIDDDDTEIVLNDTSQGFVPRGWVLIESEWIYYDGYDNYNVDTMYRLYNCKRGCLGTVAAAHSDGETAQEMLGKQIAPRPITVENDPLGGVDWVKLRRKKEYDAHAALGCFILPQPYEGVYQGTYSVYDEDGAWGGTPISLNDVVEQLLAGNRTYGGPQFASGVMDLDSTTAAVKINRYDYDPESKPKNVYDAIQELIGTLSLENEIKFWYKHSTGKFRLTVILNSASSFSLPNSSESMEEVSLEDCYSAVRIGYTDDQTLNRACKEYSYHQEATGADESPDHYQSCESGGDSWLCPAAANHDAAGNGGMEFTCDGAPGSKLGAVFEHQVADSIDFGHYWFGADAPVISLDRIKLKINSYRVIDPGNYGQDYHNAENEYVCRVEGCNDYNTTTHAGTWVDLGFGLEGKPNSDGTWVEGEAVAFTVRNVNAIRVVWDYMCGAKNATTYYWAFIHDIEIEGDTVKYELVQLTDDSGNVGYPRLVYAPASYEKLRGGIGAASASGGVQRVREVFIGASSQPAAVSIGRIYLITSLRRSRQRRYSYEGVLPGTPELGITITDSDGYEGVLREYSYAVGSGGAGIVTGVILDTSADVIE